MSTKTEHKQQKDQEKEKYLIHLLRDTRSLINSNPHQSVRKRLMGKGYSDPNWWLTSAKNLGLIHNVGTQHKPHWVWRGGQVSNDDAKVLMKESRRRVRYYSRNSSKKEAGNGKAEKKKEKKGKKQQEESKDQRNDDDAYLDAVAGLFKVLKDEKDKKPVCSYVNLLWGLITIRIDHHYE